MTTRPQDGACDDGLLARLMAGRNGVHRSGDELRAHIEAEIASARCGPAPVHFDPGDDDELVEPVPAPVTSSSSREEHGAADGLKTPAQAARRLGISIRTLRGLVSSGELRYVNVGRGKQREKMMFTDNDLDDLIAGRTRQKAQQCPSTSPKVRRSTTSTSSGEVIAFTARRNGRTDAKRKR
jgi:excisionase family DNA binding protein